MSNGEDKTEQYNMGYIAGQLTGIDNRLSSIEKNISSLRTDFDDLEKGRLTKVESKMSYLWGILAVLGVIVPIVVTWAFNYIAPKI